jgi:hypothetical protein
VQPDDGPCGIDDVGRALSRERVPDAEARASLVDGDAAHGPSVASPPDGIAAGSTDLTQE